MKPGEIRSCNRGLCLGLSAVRRRGFALAMILVWLAPLPGLAQSSAPRSVDEVRQSYRAALAKIEQSVNDISGKGLKEVSHPPQERTDELEFAVSAGNLLVKRHVRMHNETDKKDYEDVVGRNPRYWFHLARNESSLPYAIKDLGSNANGEERTHLMQLSIVDFLTASHNVMGVLVSELLDDPAFEISDVRELEENGVPLLELGFQVKGQLRNPSGVFHSGHLVVSPSEGWVIRRWNTLRFARNLPSTGSIEYGDPVHGVPFPRSVVVEHKGDAAASHTVFTFRDIEPSSHQSDAAYKLTAFGLPEPGEKPAAGLPGLAFWLFAASVVCLIAVLVLKWKAGRLAAG